MAMLFSLRSEDHTAKAVDLRRNVGISIPCPQVTLKNRRASLGEKLSGG